MSTRTVTAVTDLLYDKSIVKGGEVSRAVPVNTDGMRAIDELVRWHREQYRTVNASRPLFPSRNGKGKQRMTRRAAHNVLKRRFRGCRTQRASCNTFTCESRLPKGLYEQTGDVFTVQEMLGHKSDRDNAKVFRRELCVRPGSVAKNVFGF